ncbi:MAG TPA: hybrid sensor histidine kinase/response regulator [Opitutus sp.]|nr:hybrid sensor histidine kinase/response regulator [Opitutus sp.]
MPSAPMKKAMSSPAELAAPAAPGPAATPSPWTLPDLHGRKILIVDDDRMNIRILGRIFETQGYVVAGAGSGEEALALYPEFQPDLVLLDVMMPGIDGFETCRTLKHRHGDACAPVIFITAKNDSDDVVAGFGAGGVDYLPKPFNTKEVVARIGTHLQNQLLAEQLKSLVEQLSNANAAKNRFLGMAAHDLRNPLASIRGLAEFLRDGIVGQLTPDQLDLVNTIHGASQSMLTLVNELLDVATIEAGELKLVRESHDLGELVAKRVYLANIDAAKKETHIRFQSAPPGPRASIDAAKIQQVVDNLLSNAVKYSPPRATVTVELRATGRECHLGVKDQGPGIPPDERDRLFKDFSRLSAKPTGGEQSTGLGLAICRKIVEAHRGSITAENLPGGGCEFRVTLPLAS